MTDSELNGTCRNPWDTDRTPGGSSGGAAAALSAALCAVSHGTDGAGSVRSPASFCGLVGVKLTRGLVDFGPELGNPYYGTSGDGVLTRSVRDAAGMLGVFTNRGARRRSTRRRRCEIALTARRAATGPSKRSARCRPARRPSSCARCGHHVEHRDAGVGRHARGRHVPHGGAGGGRARARRPDRRRRAPEPPARRTAPLAHGAGAQRGRARRPRRGDDLPAVLGRLRRARVADRRHRAAAGRLGAVGPGPGRAHDDLRRRSPTSPSRSTSRASRRSTCRSAGATTACRSACTSPAAAAATRRSCRSPASSRRPNPGRSAARPGSSEVSGGTEPTIGPLAAFELAAASASRIIADPAVATSWREPSVLPRMTVGALAGHLLAVVRTFERRCDVEITATTTVDHRGRIRPGASRPRLRPGPPALPNGARRRRPASRSRTGGGECALRCLRGETHRAASAA